MRRGILAALVGALVFGVVMWARAPVGVGTYYDDGIYLALGRSLAEGNGYHYANLPGDVPGVKYPPVYPALLAGAWRLLGPYPASLGTLKTINAALYGGAAALTFLLFAGGGPGRRLALAAVTAIGFLLIPGLSISTALLSEPLFLLLAAAALLCAQARREDDRPGAWKGGTVLAGRTGPGRRHVLPGAGAVVAAAFLAAAAALTRSVGITLVLALVVGEAARRRAGATALAALLSFVPLAAWATWVVGHGAAVPDIIAGTYGGYVSWYAAGGGVENLLGRLWETAQSNWEPLIETLRFVWIPGAPAWAGIVVLTLASGVGAVGLRSTARRNPALAIFVPLYIALVLVWPYEPYRFYYAALPLLTLLLAEGAAALLRRYRREFPGWGLAVAGTATAVLVMNTLFYQARGYRLRTWTLAQTVPARTYAPAIAWVRDHAPPDAVIASGLDPYIYWETGRPAVPSWSFDAAEYLSSASDSIVLAAELQGIRETFRPAYVVVVRGDNQPAAVARAYAATYPERIDLVFESEEGRRHDALVYRLNYP